MKPGPDLNGQEGASKRSLKMVAHPKSSNISESAYETWTNRARNKKIADKNYAAQPKLWRSQPKSKANYRFQKNQRTQPRSQPKLTGKKMRKASA